MILIPQPFEEKLKLDTSDFFIGAVKTTCNLFNEVLSENHLYFFEEFTDHGIRHINSVLESCSKLITPETYKLLNEKDISILILGVLLHDLGMHIKPLTFERMIAGDYDDILSNDFADEKWSILWNIYLTETKKFNDQQRIKIFGKPDIDITEPCLSDPDSLTGVQKKLIGEFIRRHHPRIAYEVAFKGLVAHNYKQIEFCSILDDDYKRLAGLLARSHGINIRDTFLTLDKFYGRAWKRPFDINIIYLMTVLRLADYFQIDSKRVLKIPYLTKAFRSPVSFIEHQKHLQTKYVQQLDDDPETLFITANPTTSVYFSALETLFNDIQQEVDNSWAILGEIYGSKPYVEQPRLTYRRIRSNLDNKKIFSSNVTYIPEKISFEVDKEVPKLLVGPLYGYEPSFGVRELLQNAVDACWEREFYETKKGHSYHGEIEVKIESKNGQLVLSITDNGKGMTLDEIKNYFLKIGGSFRKSHKWRTEFEDDNGRSKVNKSGRFGIGILSAYLLGMVIEVKTKSIFSPTGYGFTTMLDQEQIEVTKEEIAQVGTAISIVISHSTYKKLMSKKRIIYDEYLISKKGGMKTVENMLLNKESWLRFDQWYTLQTPKISFKMPHGDVESDHAYLPGLNDFDDNWNEIHDDQFKKIVWSHSSKLQGTLICNGFIIPERYTLDTNLIPPALMIFDFDAKLPLNLNRTSVNSLLPIKEKLLDDIYKDFIACLLLQTIDSPFSGDNVAIKKDSIKYTCICKLVDETENVLTIVYCRDGFVINHAACLNQLAGLNHLKIIVKEFEDGLILNEVRAPEIAMVSILESGRELFKLELQNYLNYFVRHNNLIGMTNNMYIKTPVNLQQFKKYEIELIQQWKIPHNTHLIYYEISQKVFEQDALGNALLKYLGNDLVIPYNFEERKRKFPRAFDELKKYMKKYNN